MLILGIIGAAVGVLVLAVLVVGFTSPRMARMKRSIEIKAPPTQVFPYLNRLKKFVDHWSPWTAKDPQAKHEYNDVAEGVGARYSWTGDPKKVGTGSMEIRESEPGKRVKTFLRFKGRGEAWAAWVLEDLGNGSSRLTWDFEADHGNNPIARIFGRLIEKFLSPDYEQGLAKLKSICEKTS
jgi:uncharacterized protein YndB with AHSA1/START domain